MLKHYESHFQLEKHQECAFSQESKCWQDSHFIRLKCILRTAGLCFLLRSWDYFRKPSGATAERNWRGKATMGAHGNPPCDCTSYKGLLLTPLPFLHTETHLGCSTFPSIPSHHTYILKHIRISMQTTALSSAPQNCLCLHRPVNGSGLLDRKPSASCLLYNTTRLTQSKAQVDPRIILGPPICLLSDFRPAPWPLCASIFPSVKYLSALWWEIRGCG